MTLNKTLTAIFTLRTEEANRKMIYHYAINMNELIKRGLEVENLDDVDASFCMAFNKPQVTFDKKYHHTLIIDEVEIVKAGRLNGEVILHCLTGIGECAKHFTLSSDILLVGEVEDVIFCAI